MYMARETKRTKRDTRTWIIYGLRCKGETTIRYVGQTKSGLKKRLAGHSKYPTSPMAAEWIKEMADQCKEIEAIQLATATNRGEAFIIERMWIKSMTFVFGELMLNTFNRGDFFSLADLQLAAARESRKLRFEHGYKTRYQKGWRCRKRRPIPDASGKKMESR